MIPLNIHFKARTIETLFLVSGDDGQIVEASPAAMLIAVGELGTDASNIVWVTPPVFGVRYGSCWVATAISLKTGQKIRFHTSDEGTFLESDALRFEDERMNDVAT